MRYEATRDTIYALCGTKETGDTSELTSCLKSNTVVPTSSSSSSGKKSANYNKLKEYKASFNRVKQTKVKSTTTQE